MSMFMIRARYQVPIVTGATAYNEPSSGKTFILLFNEALHYGIRMDHSLFKPNKLWMCGIPVRGNRFDHDKSFSIQVTDAIEIPLMPQNNDDQFRYREDLSVDGIMLNEISLSLPGINEENSFKSSVDDIPRIMRYVSSDRYNQVSKENISEILRIGPNKAKQMLQVTRQYGTRSTILPIGERYRADRMYDVKRLHGNFFN